MKKSLARKAIRTGILAAGFLLLSGGAVQAADLGTTGNYGAGNGNQVVAAVQAPITACGNAVAVAGTSNAWCNGDATANIAPDALNNLWSSDNYGLLNGNQAAATVQAPIAVCGNAVAVLGASNAGCSGNSSANMGRNHVESAPVTEVAPITEGRSYDLVSYGNYGALNGNQVAAIAQAPIAVCGNAVAAGGVANAGCDGSVHAVAKPSLTPNMYTSDNFGLGNGNQVGLGVQAPITACGNAVAVLGASNAGCRGNATAQSGSDHDSHDHHSHGDVHTTKSTKSTKTTKEAPAAARSTSGLGGLDSLTGLLG
ncbi:chaplin family protein [Phytomonospora sp. NPDC050363]|uniref:chaplin family protein n=1 Tax=Phytomonospora sp. NPDC050363 TaxID=3155642 RepID=UPI0033CCC623